MLLTLPAQYAAILTAARTGLPTQYLQMRWLLRASVFTETHGFFHWHRRSERPTPLRRLRLAWFIINRSYNYKRTDLHQRGEMSVSLIGRLFGNNGIAFPSELRLTSPLPFSLSRFSSCSCAPSLAIDTFIVMPRSADFWPELDLFSIRLLCQSRASVFTFPTHPFISPCSRLVRGEFFLRSGDCLGFSHVDSDLLKI